MTLQRLANIPWRALSAWLSGNRLRILMYHSISENPRDPHAIPATVFERHMRALQSAHVISLEEGLQRLTHSHHLKNTVIITFDDALLDFSTTALPVLRDFAYSVTMFVPTGLAGQTAKWDSYDKTKPLMTWQQLGACQQWKVSFGSHTVKHTRLIECSDADLEFELQASLSTLRQRLENVIPALAYPGGYQDARVRQAARATGYVCALGPSSRWGNGPETDLFQLRRQHFPL